MIRNRLRVRAPAPFEISLTPSNAIFRTGFTLIELLIAVSIFATVATVLYSCFRTAITSSRRINDEIAFQQKARYILDIITKDFKNMAHLSNIPFKGSAEKVSFVSILTLSDDASDNAAMVSYYLASGEGEGYPTLLIRKKNQIIDALHSKLEEAKEEDEAAKGRVIKEKTEEKKTDTKAGEEMLTDNVSALKFTYLAANVPEEPFGRIEYEWLDAWEAEDLLPLGIRVELTLTDLKNNAPITLSRRIWVPAGMPPEKKIEIIEPESKL